MRVRAYLAAAIAVAMLIPSAGATCIGREEQRVAARAYGYRVVRSYPHDRTAYTQGLVYHDGALYEGTGLHGESTLRKVKLETGEVLQVRRLDSRYFGEGIAIVKDRLFQLTWQTEVGFVYDLASFEQRKTFRYRGEGWGLTYDGRRLIMSDGTPALRFLEPEALRETGRVTVRDAGLPVEALNELEVVKQEIFANVYQTSRVARIDPQSGRVNGWIDLSGLLTPRELEQLDPANDVLNGIAYDAAGDRLFVTGKRWPRLFEIQLVER